MSVNWNSHEMSVWKEQAINEQQAYFNVLEGRTWTKYKQSDYNNLRRNIGFALFRLPGKEPNETNDYTGYEKRQLSCINTIFDVIKNYKQEHRKQEVIYVSFLFVYGKMECGHATFPVICVRKCESPFHYENVFIDSCARVYENWQDYLENNRLPECALCYPRNGIYSAVNGQVQVEFGISPAGMISSKVLQGLDIAGTVLGLGASGIAVTALFVPVALPFIIGAGVVCASTALYSGGRNIQTLVDRSQHQQSIGLDNFESRNCWLGIAGCTTAIASGGAVAVASKITQAGEAVSLAGQIALKSVTAISSFGNALGVVNGLANIIEKAVRKDEVTPLDIFQLTSSVLFFTNSVISTHQAHSLIRSIQESGRGGSSGGVDVSVNQIVKSFGTRSSNFTELTGCLTNCVIGSSPIAVSNVVQESLSSVCKWLCRKLSAITKMLLKGLMAVKEYVRKVADLLQSFWETWNEEINDVVTKICQAFGVKNWQDIIVQGSRVLQGSEAGYMKKVCGTLIAETRSWGNCGTAIRPPEQSQGIPEGNDVGANSIVLEEAPAPYDEIINIHAKFVDVQNCKTAKEFYGYMKFVCKFVKNEFEKEKLRYEEIWKMVQKFTPDVKIEDVDKEYGISGNRNNHFFQEVFKKFKPGEKEGLFFLKLAYDSQKAVTSGQEELGQSFFKIDEITFRPFCNKAGLACDGMLSEEQYYQIAAELTKQHADKGNVALTVEGMTAVMLVNQGEFVITVNSYLEDGKVSGIAAMLQSPHK